MDKQQLINELLEYVAERFLDEESRPEFTASTPLLEWGILNSMNTALLLTHVRETYGAEVQPQDVTGRNLGSVNALAKLVMHIVEDDVVGVGRE